MGSAQAPPDGASRATTRHSEHQEGVFTCVGYRASPQASLPWSVRRMSHVVRSSGSMVQVVSFDSHAARSSSVGSMLRSRSATSRRQVVRWYWSTQSQNRSDNSRQGLLQPARANNVAKSRGRAAERRMGGAKMPDGVRDASNALPGSPPRARPL